MSNRTEARLVRLEDARRARASASAQGRAERRRRLTVFAGLHRPGDYNMAQIALSGARDELIEALEKIDEDDAQRGTLLPTAAGGVVRLRLTPRDGFGIRLDIVERLLELQGRSPDDARQIIERARRAGRPMAPAIKRALGQARSLVAES